MPWDFALIVFLLGAVVPWRGRARIRKLLAMPQVSAVERLGLYAATIVFQWALVAVVAWRCWARGLSAAELGLLTLNWPALLVVTVFGSGVLAGVQWRGWKHRIRHLRPSHAAQQALAERIFPQSSAEAPAFFALAVTAGVCEEFLYRGFLMAALARAGLSAWAIVFTSSILFGLAHIYQGWNGALATALLGLVFGGVRIAVNTLLPVVVWHTTIDAVGGIVGLKLMRRNSSLSRN